MSSTTRPCEILLTCEHASNAVPPGLEHLFAKHTDRLQSHQGWDPGAWPVFRALQNELPTSAAFDGKYTRLAVELNRSEGHPGLFSNLVASLPASEKHQLLAQIWHPFRNTVRQHIQHILEQKNASYLLHLSIHSFTPVWNSEVRNAEIGLLYDPRRPAEKKMGHEWALRLRTHEPSVRVRLNYPYKGISDGHTTSLRKQFGERYLGFEIELKQDWLAQNQPVYIAHLLAQSLPELASLLR